MGKKLLQYLLKCALHLSFWRFKCYCSRRNAMGTDRENIVPGNLCIIKANVRYRQKPSFLLKNVYLYNLIWYLAALNTLNTRDEVLYFKEKLTLSKTTKWLSMSLVANQEGGFSLFHLFGIVSGTFQAFLACYGLFRVFPFFASKDVTECFDQQIYYKSTSCRFYYKGW